MVVLVTTRLHLIPFTLKMVKSAINGRAKLAEVLGVTVPESWPNEDFCGILPLIADNLLDNPSLTEWGRIIIHKSENTLIGDIGFKGLRDATGTVEIGYGIVPSHQRQGYASEAAKAMVNWAFTQSGVQRVTAECLTENISSIRVLEKIGMQHTGIQNDVIMWEVRKIKQKRSFII